MGLYDTLKADADAQAKVVDQIVALVAQLQAAVSTGDPAVLAAAMAEIEASTKVLQGLVPSVP